MPIYEYLCGACGHQEDHLQKISEPALAKCPACGKKKYAKQLTAAGFQLKGSGWYATDFKSGPKKPEDAKPEAKVEAKKDEAKTEAKTETKTETKAEKKKTPASTTN
jgi:putative FmdB family regulatory protein